MKRFPTDERGSTLVFLALLLPVLIGMAALAIDTAKWRYDQGRLQIGADAAALSAARALPDTSNALSQALVAAGENIPASFGSAISSSSVVFGTYNKTSKTFTASATNVNAVRVTARRTTANGNASPTFFGRILGLSSADIGASTTAVQVAPPYCVIALGTTQNKAFSVGGGGTFSVPNCGVGVNSASSSAATAGNNTTTVASAFCVVGGYSGSFSPTPQTGCGPVADPLAPLPEPTPPATCDSNNYTASAGTTTLNPGKYCGALKFSGTSAVVLNPGNYYFQGATVNFSQSAGIQGSGVFIFLDATSVMNITGGGTVSLSAPTSGTYSGVAVFQSRSATSATLKFGGSSSFLVDGAIYAPASSFVMNGTSTVSDVQKTGYVIAYDISFTGASTFKLGSQTGRAPAALSARESLVY